jgi:hypothetical protein
MISPGFDGKVSNNVNENVKSKVVCPVVVPAFEGHRPRRSRG